MAINLKIRAEKYLESRREVWSPNTYKAFKGNLNLVIKHGFLPDLVWKALNAEGYSKYNIFCSMRAARTFEIEMLTTKHYHTWFQKNKHLLRNAYPDRSDRVITQQKMQHALIMALNLADPRLYNLLVLMADAGLRITEARYARWKDVDKERGTIKVLGKGGKEARVSFTSRLLETEAEFIAGPEIPYRAFFAKHMPGFSPHDFRAYFITKCSKNMSAFQCQKQARHSSISTTQKYIRHDEDEIRNITMQGGFNDSEEVHRRNQQAD